ncbi:alpha/beta hydrolase [Undibacterium sp. RTI2.1]|uniref:alpha/beta hydrolase n=1 Tax=unclassified Undibacterium TaxID=2630295 RepID=UPI002AB36A7E|nr:MULTISPECIES: alpha/beta hydrolase [unclassified Undibacterium]MDY7539312.1 alpha/beta hydrolase [Undibacterium sp. 5I1]MEB0031414.1 alpha/beta hydrolase [Undibacterium sp. RTI2.1]MEB0117755.1 alpha/beta hydrolase [Undibacterium sp. RTI2.2]MEB0232777.1 alpha/beta hydrolase [Undibacterium sp. 10I3]MEB0259529.1 alpha/beta hydrolase [Undibacterium sp. 5I1]
MNAQTEHFFTQGAVGQLECALDLPDAEHFPAPRGLALVAHPHPLFGGTMDNKIAQTLARAFVTLGYVAVRMNFRGVGKSEGVHDNGVGETDDMALLLAQMRTRYPDLPLALGGFSFGTFVQAQLQQKLIAQGTPAERLALIGTAAGKWPMPDVPANTILIHGELDDTIPLQAVFDWARPQDIPVIVIPGADHFFHRKLQHIKNYVVNLWDESANAS